VCLALSDFRSLRGAFGLVIEVCRVVIVIFSVQFIVCCSLARASSHLTVLSVGLCVLCVCVLYLMDCWCLFGMILCVGCVFPLGLLFDVVLFFVKLFFVVWNVCVMVVLVVRCVCGICVFEIWVYA